MIQVVEQSYKWSFSKNDFLRRVVSLQFFFLCTTFNLFTYEGRNLLFVGFTLVATVLLVGMDVRRVPLPKASLVLLAAYLTISFLPNILNAKFTSFLYSIYFVFAFWLMYAYMEKHATREQYLQLLKLTLLAYFAVLVLGQLYVARGMFHMHSTAETNVIHNPLGTLFEIGRGFRYYSLSTEPSCAAFIVIILFYSYLINSPHKPFSSKHLLLWLVTFYMIYFFKSGYGIILFALLLVMLMRRLETLIPLVVLGGIFAGIAVAAKTSAIERVMMIVDRVDFSDLTTLKNVDYSASFRVLPMVYYWRDINLFDWQFYLGHGAGTSVDYLIPLLFRAPIKTFEGGFLPQFLYDYGILVVIAIAFFVREYIMKRSSFFELSVIALMLTNANFNTQLFWVTIACFALNKMFLTNRPPAHETAD